MSRRDRRTTRAGNSENYSASEMKPLVSLASSNQSDSSSVAESTLDISSVATFDEALLPARSKMALPLTLMLLLMIINSYMGTSAWWYTSGQSHTLVYGFIWSEFGLSIALNFYLLYVRYYGLPRVRGAGFERIAVYADSHYFWATLSAITAVVVSGLTLMFFGAWRLAFAPVDGFLTKLVNISSLSIQTAKMHSDYLLIHMFHTLGTVVFVITFYGAVHREYNPIFSSPVDAILKAKSSEAKAQAIRVAQGLAPSSVLT